MVMKYDLGDLTIFYETYGTGRSSSAERLATHDSMLDARHFATPSCVSGWIGWRNGSPLSTAHGSRDARVLKGDAHESKRIACQPGQRSRKSEERDVTGANHIARLTHKRYQSGSSSELADRKPAISSPQQRGVLRPAKGASPFVRAIATLKDGATVPI